MARAIDRKIPRPNVVQRPDLIARLQQFVGLRQRYITPVLAQELVPVIIVGDLERQKGVRPSPHQPIHPLTAAATLTAGPTVAQFSRIMLRNPLGSARVLRLVYLNFGNAAAGAIQVGYWLATPTVTPTDLASVGGALGVDLRHQREQSLDALIRPAGITSSDTNAALVGTQDFFRVDASFISNFPLESGDDRAIVLDEGDALLIQSSAVNQQVAGNLIWSEESKVSQ